MASRGLRAVSLSGWTVISGELLAVVTSLELFAWGLSVSDPGTREVRNSCSQSATSRTRSTKRRLRVLRVSRIHFLTVDFCCIVIPHHPHPQPHPQSSQSHKVFPPPCALLRARYCCASPLVILNLRHLPSPQISLCSQRLVGCSLQTRKFRIRYPGSGAQTPP